MRTSGTVIRWLSSAGSCISPRDEHLGQRMADQFADAQRALRRRRPDRAADVASVRDAVSR